MNARLFTKTLTSAAIGSIATLVLTGSPLWAQKPEATTPPANSTAGGMTNQHQQMMDQMQQMMGSIDQMMEKCKSQMNQGMMGNGNAHTGGAQGQHGQGSTNHTTR